MIAVDEAYKVGFCGNCGVGKTSLIELIWHDFVPTSSLYASTIGVAFRSRTVVLPSHNNHSTAVRLMFCDISGQESTASAVTTQFFRGLDALVVVYDITDKQTFANVKTWVARRHERTRFVILVGNKLDMAARRRAVTVDEAKRYCAENDFSFFETSATDATNVEQMTLALATRLSQNKPLSSPPPSRSSPPVSLHDGVSIADTQDKRSECGC
jgi:small GTP-binding protein